LVHRTHAPTSLMVWFTWSHTRWAGPSPAYTRTHTRAPLPLVFPFSFLTQRSRRRRWARSGRCRPPPASLLDATALPRHPLLVAFTNNPLSLMPLSPVLASGNPSYCRSIWMSPGISGAATHRRGSSSIPLTDPLQPLPGPVRAYSG
jgi:hypothetical protein